MDEKTGSPVAEIVGEVDQLALKLESTMNEMIDLIQSTSAFRLTGEMMPHEEYDQRHNRHIILRNLVHTQRDELRYKLMDLFIALYMDDDLKAIQQLVKRD